ncbi:MAG: right-handed parallel beta-helix repeat-containing protein [bacterium]
MKSIPELLLRSNLILAISVNLTVIIILAAVRSVWKIPKPLLLVIGIIFLACSVVISILNRKGNMTARQLFIRLPLAWIIASGLVLGTVHHFDRAGWLWFKMTGYNVALAEDFFDLTDISPGEFVAQNKIFSLHPQDSTKVILAKGQYNIDETVIVPKDVSLTIEPGAVLRFAVGRSLISYSPITARGTEREPIVFTAQNKWRKWGVVGVVSKGKSVFKHVVFEHGRQALVNNIDFFGSLSFMESDVEITHSQFKNLFGKDAVYVREGQVLIRDNLFKDVFKDGVDLDGGTGEISHNQFINCGDEGIDLSLNFDVRVFDNKILDPKGGRIAADHSLEEIRAVNTFGHSAPE